MLQLFFWYLRKLHIVTIHKFTNSRNFKWVAKWVIKKKRTSIFNELTFFLVVEAMGVEPMSEKSSV